jgi:hypothetical protein
VACAAVAVLALLLVCAVSIGAAPGPESGSVNLTGIVPGPPPTTAAVITKPSTNDRFDDSTIIIEGTCEDAYVIEIYRNGAFAGSVLCSAGVFSISITVLPGENTLLAKTRDMINQYGPDSVAVVVYFDIPNVDSDGDEQPSATGEQPGSTNNITSSGTIPPALPLIIATDALTQGVNISEAVVIGFTISGGSRPYAVTVSWGDGSEDTLYSYAKTGDYKVEHNYTRPGQYQVTIRAVDTKSQKAIIQTIVVVNGKSALTTTETASPAACAGVRCTNQELVNQFFSRWWPIVTVSVISLLFFTLGLMARKRKKHDESKSVQQAPENVQNSSKE